MIEVFLYIRVHWRKQVSLRRSECSFLILRRVLSSDKHHSLCFKSGSHPTPPRLLFLFLSLIPLVWIGLEEWEVREVRNTNHSFTHIGFLRIPIRSSSRNSIPCFIHFIPRVLREERIFGGIGRSWTSFHVAPSNAALLFFCLLLPRVYRWHRSEVVSLHSPPRKDQQNADLELSFLFVFIFSVFVYWFISRSDSLRNSRLFIRLFVPIIVTLFFTFLKILWLYFFLILSLTSKPFKYFLIPIYAAALLGMVRELLSSVTSLLVLISGVLFALILVSSPLVECDWMEFASVDFGIIRFRFCFISALSALERIPLFRLRFLSLSI